MTRGVPWKKTDMATLVVQSGCETRLEFKRKHTTAYSVMCKNGWREELLAHLPNLKRGKIKWPYSLAKETADRYQELPAFAREHPRLLAIIRKNGWQELYTHMKHGKKGKEIIWTKTACAAAAKPHDSRSAFKMAEPSAHRSASARGWLDEITAHMKRRSGNRLRALYVIREIGTRRVYIGLTYDPKTRYSGHLRSPSKRMRVLLCQPHIFRVITGLMDTEKAASAERYLIRRFRELSWEVVNFKSGGDVGCGKRKHTLETLQPLANQCETRGDMWKRFRSPYTAAVQQRLIDTLFANHPHRGYEKKRRTPHPCRGKRRSKVLAQLCEPIMNALSDGAHYKVGQIYDRVAAPNQKQWQVKRAIDWLIADGKIRNDGGIGPLRRYSRV